MRSRRVQAPKGKLFLALEELKQLSDRSQIVAQHVSAAIPAATTTRQSVGSSALRYARPSFDRAEELDEAIGHLQMCMVDLRKSMAAATAAGIEVQGLDERLKTALAEQRAMDISGADRRELQRRGLDTAVGGGALDRPNTALGLTRPSSAGVWSTPGTPAGRGGSQRRPQSSAGVHGRHSPLPPRPATATGMASTVHDDKSFMSIMSDEPSRDIVQSAARPTSGARSKLERPPTASYTFQSKGVGTGPKRTVKPIVTARQLAKAGDWAELYHMLSADDDLTFLAGSAPGSVRTLGELYQLRGQALARTASSPVAFAAALRDLSAALSRAPWQPAAFYWRGVCQMRLAEPSFEAVQRDMEACLQLQDPTEACAWHRLGRAQLQLKRYNLAVTSASRALRVLEKNGWTQQPTECEVILGLRSEILLCRGLATLRAGNGKPTAAATLDFAAIATDDPGFAARWLSDPKLSFASVVELRDAFTEDAFVSQRYVQGLVAKGGSAEAAVAELGRLLCLRSDDALSVRQWALSERLRLMALELSPPANLALQMMASDRAELVEPAAAAVAAAGGDNADSVALAAEVHLARAFVRAVPVPRRSEALQAWDRARALPSASYDAVAALDTAGTPDYLLGRLAWGGGGGGGGAAGVVQQDLAAGKDARAHFLKSWSEGYRFTVESTPEILGCLAAARLAATLKAPAPPTREGDDEEQTESSSAVPSLASLAIAAAVRRISSVEEGGAGAEPVEQQQHAYAILTCEDSLHMALLLITSPTVEAAESYRAVPDKDKKKWTQEEKDAEERAKAAAESDIALAHQHLVVRQTHGTQPCLRLSTEQFHCPRRATLRDRDD